MSTFSFLDKTLCDRDVIPNRLRCVIKGKLLGESVLPAVAFGFSFNSKSLQ